MSRASCARFISSGWICAMSSSILLWATGGCPVGGRPSLSLSRLSFMNLSWRAHTSTRASVCRFWDSSMRRRRVRALEWPGSRSRTASQSERARSGKDAFSYMADRLFVSVMIWRVSDEDDLVDSPSDAADDLMAVLGRFCSMRSSASVNVSAASINFFSLKRAFPARSISSMRRCNALSSSVASEVLEDVAAVVVVVVLAEEEDAVVGAARTFDFVGVMPESTEDPPPAPPPASFVGNDFDFFLAALPSSFFEEMYHRAAAVANAARPMTMYVVWWLLLLPIFSGDSLLNAIRRKSHRHLLSRRVTESGG
mmetsp:Transcript_21343/g.51592  ORF Transcript_21343/g.51592 Transcript_21343/m.51592 type:complete len:311 (+) Transcript_21343:1369-2301(+)